MNENELRNPTLFAKLAFDLVATKLSAFNLSDIWSINALFSSIEYFDSLENGYNSFFPFLNFDKVSMLSKAIIASNSREYKDKQFDTKLIPIIFNKLIEATNTSEFIEEDKDDNYKLLNFMSRKSTSSYELQNLDIKGQIARSYALYEYFPNKYKNEIMEKHKSNYVNIPKVFYEKYGLTIKDYLLIGILIIFKNQNIYNRFFKIDNMLTKEIIEKKKNNNEVGIVTNSLAKIIDITTDSRKNLFFKSEELILPDKNIVDIDIINNFLKLVTKTSKELSVLENKEPYKKGELVYRLSPLQRFPLLKVDGNRYIVPNLRYFISSFTKNIHFILQDLYPENAFNETFGSIFEYYVNDFVQDRLDSVTIIPETRYSKSRNDIDGPDLSIIDKDNNSIILIEVKSKNLRLDTKLAPLSNELIKDLDRSFNALIKLPNKYDDLLFGFKEYNKWQKDINSIAQEDKSNVYALSIINQGMLFLPEIINLIRKNEKKHFLNSYPFKFGIISIENFELAVELAHEKKKSFSKLLLSYCESAMKADLKEHSAEQFNGLTLESKDTYLRKMFDIMIEKIKREQ
jgi:hypothetical protein